jgi:hypothetical protein
MIQKGVVLSLSDSNKKYKIIDRLDDIGQGEGGWLCVDTNAITEDTDSISAFDCWRITDRYLDIQIQRGVITIVN